jgi:hypothetical protein
MHYSSVLTMLSLGYMSNYMLNVVTKCCMNHSFDWNTVEWNCYICPCQWGNPISYSFQMLIFISEKFQENISFRMKQIKEECSILFIQVNFVKRCRTISEVPQIFSTSF